MPLIERTDAANRDLISIAEYIAGENPDAAERVLDAVENKCNQLLENPRMGAECNDLADGLRQFWVSPYPYVLFYRIIDEGIRLIRVLHGHRDIPSVFRSENPET